MFTRRRTVVSLAVVSCTTFCTTLSTAWANPNDVPKPTSAAVRPSNEVTWHARLGVGVNPIFETDNILPIAKTGFGGTISGFYQLPYRLSVGAGYDWERYTYDTTNVDDPPTTPPRYVDRELIYNRLQALLQWDVLPKDFVTPFLLVGAGYGWEPDGQGDSQCRSKPFALGAGAGIEMALGPAIGVGFEYRINAPLQGATMCTTAAQIGGSKGAPDITFHRFGLTFNVRH